MLFSYKLYFFVKFMMLNFTRRGYFMFETEK
jgi:hypothetical protein